MFLSAKQGTRRNARWGQRGFTLIELLVVISIIGILAAVALPQLTPELDKARRSAARAEAVQLYTAFMRYFNENGAYPEDTTVTNYNSLKTEIQDQLSLPAETDANFTVVTYTDDNASSPKNFTLVIKARDGAQTQYTITRTGVATP